MRVPLIPQLVAACRWIAAGCIAVRAARPRRKADCAAPLGAHCAEAQPSGMTSKVCVFRTATSPAPRTTLAPSGIFTVGDVVGVLLAVRVTVGVALMVRVAVRVAVTVDVLVLTAVAVAVAAL